MIHSRILVICAKVMLDLKNKEFIIWPQYYTKEFRFCGNKVGKIAHLARSGSQTEHRIRFILPARGASHIIKKVTHCAEEFTFQRAFTTMIRSLDD